MQRQHPRDRVQAFHAEEALLRHKELSLIRRGCVCGLLVGGVTVAIIGVIIISWLLRD